MNQRIKVLFSQLLKRIFANNLLEEGRVRTILWGPEKGLKYRIFAGFGLSPLYGGWERDAQRLMVQYIKPGSIAYDIGANYGIHSILMARLTKENGHVYAFEPMPSISAALRENISLNALTNTSVVEAAVSDVSGRTQFVIGHHEGAGKLVASDDGEEAALYVDVVTIDEFVFNHRNPAPDFIKVDVEGFESNVLRGGKEVLKRFRPTMLIDLHTPEQDAAVGQILSGLGYIVFRTDKMERVQDLTRVWPHPEGIWGQIIAIPIEATAESRGL